MSFLRVLLFTLIYYLLLHLGFCTSPRTLACEFAIYSSLLFILFLLISIYFSGICDEAFVITIITIYPYIPFVTD